MIVSWLYLCTIYCDDRYWGGASNIVMTTKYSHVALSGLKENCVDVHVNWRLLVQVKQLVW